MQRNVLCEQCTLAGLLGCRGVAACGAGLLPHLEDMERLKLDAARAVFQQHHHLHQVLDIADVLHHQPHIGAVQQQLTKQLQQTDE